jgi:hypothetical protein
MHRTEKAGKPEGKRQLGGPSSHWQNIKIGVCIYIYIYIIVIPIN